nr:PREDICTED: acylphosphatase-2 isoform X1 [Bos indicus]
MCPLPLAAAAVTAPRSPLRLLGRGLAAAMSTGRPLKSVDYEVFGRVQGVCFRMYTEDEARKIGVVGWVKNTSKGTVTGQVQGPEEKVNSIKTPLPFTDLSHPYQGQEQHIKSTSFQGTDDWNTPQEVLAEQGWKS